MNFGNELKKETVVSFQITRVDLAEWMTWFQKPDEAELKTYDNRPLA